MAKPDKITQENWDKALDAFAEMVCIIQESNPTWTTKQCMDWAQRMAVLMAEEEEAKKKKGVKK